jgi:hypothetical protein
MGQARSFERIKPPNRFLREKVTASPGPSRAAIVAAAEAAVQELGKNYLTWVREDVETLEAALDGVGGETTGRVETTSRVGAIERIFDTAHNMKGQGATFGYPLVTTIAASLCRFIEAGGADRGSGADVIQAHVAALRAVIVHEARGEGGEVGRELVRTLEAVVAKHLANPR